MYDMFHSGRPWEYPEATSFNRLPMRSPLYPFPVLDAAVSDAVKGPRSRLPGGAPSDNPLVVSLDGEWNFRLLDTPEAFSEELVVPGSDHGDWKTIRVPGTWSLQGFDKPHYTNVVMPFGNVPPSSPKKNPTGIYRKEFTLPSGWLQRRTVLRVGSAESFLSVFLNGRHVGFSKDSRLPAEFDLTPFLASGTNLLVLMVVRYGDSSFIEDQDQWWLGGLHRSVVLYSTDHAFIQDAYARTRMIGGSDSGLIECTVRLSFTFDPAPEYPEGTAPADYREPAIPGTDQSEYRGNYRVRAFVSDSAGGRIPGSEAEAVIGGYYRESRWEAVLSLPVPKPHIWSSEEPALYAVAVTLIAPDGRELEHAAFRTGFRSVEVKNRALLINGKRVFIRGANRHEHDERTGKTQSTDDMIRDIEILKRHNFNAVRTSHYPNDERWYDLCDEFGIYLVDEANIESHGYYDHLCRDPRWAQAFLDRGMRMVLRDRNHPSVILWSLGNESGYGHNHELLAAWIRSSDPTRPLHYEGPSRSDPGQGPSNLESLKRGHSVSDIVSTMYSPIRLLKDWDSTTDDYRPFILCEFSHAMGNSNGSLSDYWKVIENSRGLQGGFIWEWIDHGILAGDEGADVPTLTVPPGPAAASGIKPWRYGGDFGDLPSDLDFVVDGLLFPDRSPKPAMAECAKLFQQIRVTSLHPESGRILVENRYDFTNLEKLSLVWKIIAGVPDGMKAEKPGADLSGIVASGTIALPVIPPGKSAELEIRFPQDVFSSGSAPDGEYYLVLEFILDQDTPWAGKGHRIAWEQFPLFTREGAPVSRSTPAGDNLPVAGFSPDGFLSSLKTGLRGKAREILRSPLVPCLFRAPTQNDGLKNFRELRGKPEYVFYYTGKAMYGWFDTGLDRLRFERIDSGDRRQVQGDGGKTVYRILTSSGMDAGLFSQKWTVDDPDGLTGEFTFDLSRELPELPRIGLSCMLDPVISGVRWFGRGPHECYADRKAGAALGVYESEIDGLYVPYIVPQENGNRTDVRWLELHGDEGSGTALRIEGDCVFDFSLGSYTDIELWQARHADELPPPAIRRERGSVLHLDVLNRGVGTATCGPDTLERYRVRPGLYRMRLRFVNAGY